MRLAQFVSHARLARPIARAITQPILDFAFEIDARFPGYLRYLLAASDTVRQANFAILRQIDWQNPELVADRLRQKIVLQTSSTDPLGIIGECLFRLSARSMVEVAFGSVPKGFMGFLGRLGHSPIAIDVIKDGFGIFNDPERNRQRIAVLQQISDLAEIHVRLAMRLDGPLLHRGLISSISLEHVLAAQELLALMRTYRPDLDDRDIRHSLDGWAKSGAHKRYRSMGTWARSILEKSPLARLPVESGLANDPSFAVMSPADIVQAARRYRNCLHEQRLGHLIGGRRSYVEWQGSPKAIVELCVLRCGSGEARYALGEIQAMDRSEGSHDEIARRLELHGALVARSPHDRVTLKALGVHSAHDDFGEYWMREFDQLLADAA